MNTAAAQLDPNAPTTFNVLLHGSHPDEENDDCHTGATYATLEEAMAAYNDPWGVGGFNALHNRRCTAFFEIDGPTLNEVRANPDFVKSRDDDSEWRMERAMQAGMAFGCAGFNDEMGY